MELNVTECPVRGADWLAWLLLSSDLHSRHSPLAGGGDRLGGGEASGPAFEKQEEEPLKTIFNVS